MGRRLDLHAELLQITGPLGVYFQPPATVQMQYPCIVYERDYALTGFADNDPYRHIQRYQLTVIDKNPDSEILPQVARLRTCVFIRHFAADNLNHDIYTLYY